MSEDLLNHFKESIVSGIYRHFKGNLYEAYGVAIHSETREPMVVYRALYGDRGIWVRPAEMWNESVDYNGETVKRFTYVGQRTETKDE
ncbi:MAG: DUF1653 domain-containing protein [Oscillospiraceae bacterium]